MKLKARDIIPGWPRGRSTLGPLPIPAGFIIECLKFRLYNQARSIFGPSDEAFADFTVSAAAVIVEDRWNRQYHESQAAMLTDYRSTLLRIERHLLEGLTFAPDSGITREQYERLIGRSL
jgi:hypothetical protein